MLNKGEKLAVCELIASWEWSEVSSTSAASEVARCGLQLKSLFKIKDEDEDLIWSRAFRICHLVKRYYSLSSEDEFVFTVYDLIEENYELVCDLIAEGNDFKEFIIFVKERI